MTAALDDIRTEIMGRLERYRRDDAIAVNNIALAEAELEAHDRAVAAMNGTGGRRNIAAMVLEKLTSEPQTVEKLAEAIGARPHQVSEALVRLGAEKVEQVLPNTWVLVGGLDI